MAELGTIRYRQVHLWRHYQTEQAIKSKKGSSRGKKIVKIGEKKAKVTIKVEKSKRKIN